MPRHTSDETSDAMPQAPTIQKGDGMNVGDRGRAAILAVDIHSLHQPAEWGHDLLRLASALVIDIVAVVVARRVQSLEQFARARARDNERLAISAADRLPILGHCRKMLDHKRLWLQRVGS